MAISWTKAWTSADDGTVISGSDLKNLQDDIDGGLTSNATNIQGVAVDAPVAGDDGSLLFYDNGNAKFDYVTRLAVLATPNAVINATTVTATTLTGTTIDGPIGSVTPAAIIGTTLKANTSLELATGATVTGILDEDDMASDSATQLATQQSIKAYVDVNSGAPYVAGTEIEIEDTTEINDNNTSYEMIYETTPIPYSGTWTFKWDMKVSLTDNQTVYARVYADGSALAGSTEKVRTSSVWETQTDATLTVTKGTTIALYAYCINAGRTYSIKNFQILCETPKTLGITNKDA